MTIVNIPQEAQEHITSQLQGYATDEGIERFLTFLDPLWAQFIPMLLFWSGPQLNVQQVYVAYTQGWLEGYQIVSRAQLTKADWNYKQDDAEKAQKLIGNLRRNKQVENIHVRSFSPQEIQDKPARRDQLEVLNGNHRIDAFTALDVEYVLVYNFGAITREEAIRLAIELNESGFDPDPLRLGQRLHELFTAFPREDLLKTLPMSTGQIQQLTALLDFDWEKAFNIEGVEEAIDEAAKKMGMQEGTPVMDGPYVLIRYEDDMEKQWLEEVLHTSLQSEGFVTSANFLMHVWAEESYQDQEEEVEEKLTNPAKVV